MYSRLAIGLAVCAGVSDAQCTAHDILAITTADTASFQECFLVEDWSWKLSFQDCLVTRVKMSHDCAVAFRQAAFPSFISLQTCADPSSCGIAHAIRRGLSTVMLSTQSLPLDNCGWDLSAWAALEDGSDGSLPVNPQVSPSATCSTCLETPSLMTRCPNMNPGDACHTSSAMETCMACYQLETAKQLLSCSIPSDTNAHAFDCSSADLNMVSSMDIETVTKCWSETIGWQVTSAQCLSERGVSAACASYIASSVFVDSAESCIANITPSNEKTSNTCLMNVWAQGVANVISVSTVSGLDQCSDLSGLVESGSLSSLGSTCGACVSETIISAACESHCGDSGEVWSCSACLQFTTAKTLTACAVESTGNPSTSLAAGSSVLGLVLLAIAH
jgi:hypothetical protein